ncbi:anti-sigma factor family protein [Hansschlegelia zhihuaiae]|uniref:Anti-sigma factor n=1 Tax=Hansschlegelia zhihuaiae TaxID=405005 RepID=A0A4Q0MDJ7_9HYPH|nr:anti-sigma factor [Hansschlegelia zhihuaiae]RXF70886.1 anti-sigma factor [Hansschlegelia zhihuaiae]
MSSVRPISEDDLHAYIDGALDGARRAEVEAYLAENPEVAKRVQGLAEQRTMLKRAFDPIAQEPVPPELSISRMIEARRRPASFSSWRSMAAAAALLAVGAGGGWYGRAAVDGAPVGIAALAQEASDSFATFASDRGRPVEIKAEDSASLIRWVSNRLKRPVLAPDLASSGYRFMGGRVVPTPHGPAGMFMYDDDRGSRIVMLTRPMAAEKDRPVARQPGGDIARFAWAEGGMGYSLVGDVAPDVLSPLAQQISKQINET